MTAPIKRIPPAQNAVQPKGRKRTLTMDDGFVFAFGFWIATLIILVPLVLCLAALGLY